MKFILVDTRLVEPLEATVGCLVQFAGETKRDDNGKITLQARICSDVDEIDVEMYNRSIDMHRHYIASRI